MGRRYADEVSALPTTIAAAQAADIAPLKRWLASDAGSGPLIACGSGGSVAACVFAALLHEERFHRPGSWSTPLQFIRSPEVPGRAALLISAGGRNKDIMAAADRAIVHCRSAFAITARASSPLELRLATGGGSRCQVAPTPNGKDGFLATNSLLSSMVCLQRAYMDDSPTWRADAAIDVESPAETLHDCAGLIVLAAGWAMPAALDVEARWAEAGLGWTSITDPRNFAHGRHHGAIRVNPAAAFLTLETPDEAGIYEDLLSSLPPSFVVVRLVTSQRGPLGAINLVAATIRLAGAVAQRQGFDPGCPRVPEFGRRLYHLGIPPDLQTRSEPTPEIAVARKVSPEVWDALTEEVRRRFLALPVEWCRAAGARRFQGVVFDFDGTLCTTEGRFDPLPDDVRSILERLVQAGVLVGIATGRGDSAHRELRKALAERYWGSVLVGVHNGYSTNWLSEEPDGLARPDDAALLREAALALQGSPYASLIEVRASEHQLSVRSKIPVTELRAIVMSAGPDILRLAVRCSGHSVDLVPPRVTKMSVVQGLIDRLANATIPDPQILTFGDRGDVEGNDFELLSHPWSLSCDRVSPALDRCWNLAPAGVRGPDALRHYFDTLLDVGDGAVTVRSWGETPRRHKRRP